jgi:hypothetical protein
MTKKERELLEEALNQIVHSCLYGPAGDPDEAHLQASSTAFVLLERLGLKITNKEDIEKQLDVDHGGGSALFWART